MSKYTITIEDTPDGSVVVSTDHEGLSLPEVIEKLKSGLEPTDAEFIFIELTLAIQQIAKEADSVEVLKH